MADVNSTVDRIINTKCIYAAYTRIPNRASCLTTSVCGVFIITHAAELALHMIRTLALGQMTIQPFPKLQQIGQAKARAACRRFHESIGRQHISQIGRKRALCSVAVKIEHSICAPSLTTLKELVACSAQRMERMSDSEPVTLILGISCS